MKKKRNKPKENSDEKSDDEDLKILQIIMERDKKVRVGLGTMILGRLLFGKFSDK